MYNIDVANIISYNDYVEDYRLTSFDVEQERTEYFEFNELNKKLCKFCNEKMEIIYKSDNKEDRKYHCSYGWALIDHIVLKCIKCGWWKYIYECNNGREGIVDRGQTRIYKGAIKVYNSEDEKLPIDVLNEECKKNPNILYNIGTRKFEEFLQNILRGVYNCDVIHCGKTGDGGVDLIILDADEPIMVQARRRTEKRAAFSEPIENIREFLGVMFIDNYKRGIYVTTAKKYSIGAKNILEKILKKRDITKFDLIDFDTLVSIFNLQKINNSAPWEKLIKNY